MHKTNMHPNTKYNMDPKGFHIINAFKIYLRILQVVLLDFQDFGPRLVKTIAPVCSTHNIN